MEDGTLMSSGRRVSLLGERKKAGVKPLIEKGKGGTFSGIAKQVTIPDFTKNEVGQDGGYRAESSRKGQSVGDWKKKSQYHYNKHSRPG